MKQYCILIFSIFFTLSGLLCPDALKADNNNAPLPSVALLETQFIQMGFVDVQTVDPEIRVALKYASADNFMRSALYGGLKKAYLHREASLMLAQASRNLRELRPDLRLLVGDALRPRRVSSMMWAHLSGTPMQRYVADPKGGSMHNYGFAVDLTICGTDGNVLDMGTPMDFFGELAQPRHEKRLLKEGKLSEEQVSNRRLLRKVMNEAGFSGIQMEWWHFEAFDKKHIRNTYPIVE